MGRRSAEDWLAAGLNALGREGAGGLAIESLTRVLGVTKGSFYHHFAGSADFKVRLLSYWEERLTSEVIAEAESVRWPEDVLERFVESLARMSPDAERAIRAWALRDEEVRRHLEHVDAVRLEQATTWFRQRMSEADARTAARTMHALLVGCYSILPPIGGDELKQIMGEFLARYGRREEPRRLTREQRSP